MSVNVKENEEQQKENLTKLLGNDKKEELAQILQYGEKIKLEGEKKKKEFWRKYQIHDFMKLLRYKWSHKEELEKKYEYLADMKGTVKEKFIEDFLYDDMLYSGEVVDNKEIEESYNFMDLETGNYEIREGVTFDCSFESNTCNERLPHILNLKLKEGVTINLWGNRLGEALAKGIAEMKLKEGVVLNLEGNDLGNICAEIISKIKLKQGVYLDLCDNLIGDTGAKAIAEMELKEGVYLDLGYNQIGEDGAEALARIELKEGVFLGLKHNKIGEVGAEAIGNIKLKEGVYLDISHNHIGDGGIILLMDKMNLKEGVTLNLSDNDLSDEIKNKLKKWEDSYHDKGINCRVIV